MTQDPKTHASRDDVHEQRQKDQPREGVVRKPTLSQLDRDRADWEGMGPPVDSEDAPAPNLKSPSPGANSVPHQKR